MVLFWVDKPIPRKGPILLMFAPGGLRYRPWDDLQNGTVKSSTAFLCSAMGKLIQVMGERRFVRLVEMSRMLTFNFMKKWGY